LITPRQPVTVLPDTSDTRLLVELTSHASDLSEASHTLARALSEGEGSELWLPLTSHAVTVYIRPFILSKVRRRLDEMSEVPPMPNELQVVHDVIRTYRNTTIAHSQSNLNMPLPLALLDGEGRGVNVAGVSLIHPMPLAMAERFADLIAAMEDVVEQATQPVLERLRDWLKDQDPETIGAWRIPEFIDARDVDFTAAHKRNPKPRFNTYWRSEQQAGGKLP
jgi:hypothetical protein